MVAGKKRTSRQRLCSFAKHTLPTQTTVTLCHNFRAHCLPTVLGKHFPFPEVWQCYGCIGLGLCCPNPEIKCHGMPWVSRLHPLLLQNSVLISTRNSLQSLLSLWEPTLLGSELTVRTTNKHLPKPGCFTLLIYTWPRTPSHAFELDKGVPNHLWSGAEKFAEESGSTEVPPPTGCLPLQYPVRCVFFASLEGCPLPVCTMVYTDTKQLKGLSKTRQLEEDMGDGSSDLLDMTVTHWMHGNCWVDT